MKTKKNLPCNGRLKEKKSLVSVAESIIGNSSDPVKLIADLIRYQRISAKMYRDNLKVKG